MDLHDIPVHSSAPTLSSTLGELLSLLLVLVASVC